MVEGQKAASGDFFRIGGPGDCRYKDGFPAVCIKAGEEGAWSCGGEDWGFHASVPGGIGGIS